MKRRFHGVLLGLAAALALPAAAGAGEVTFGLAAALTGPIARYGVSIGNGFALAAERINAAGGVNGDTIVLVTGDERGERQAAIDVFKKLIFQDRVLAIFGPTLSNSAFAADPIANQAGVVVFATSNTAGGITDMGPFVFRNSITEADVLPEVVRRAAARFPIRKVAVLYGSDDAFTRGSYEVFTAALEAQRIPVTGTETFARGDVDFRAQLTRIKAQGPDAIVCSALAEEAAAIILQARALGIAAPFIGGNGFNSPKLFEIAGGAADDTVMGGPWAAESDTPENRAFVAAYTKKYGAEPDQFAAQAYDALHIVAAALRTVNRSGDLERDRRALRDALPLVRTTGATGPFAFRRAPAKPGVESGYDAQQAAHVFIAKGGAFVLLK